MTQPLTEAERAELMRARNSAPPTIQSIGPLTGWQHVDECAFYRLAHAAVPKLLDEVKRLQKVEHLYESLVVACHNNCTDRVLDNLATVTQDRNLLRDE